MGGKKGAERLGQEFGQRIGIGQQPHLPADALGILREVAMHALGLLQQDAGVLDQGAPGRGRLYALPLAVQQRGAERGLHVADARARRGDREMHPLGAMGDAAGLDDVQKQPQIGEIEAHRLTGFGIGEASLRQMPIVSSQRRHQISAKAKARIMSKPIRSTSTPMMSSSSGAAAPVCARPSA